MLPPRVGVEVVHDVAGAEHQDAFVAEPLEPARQLEVLLRGERLVDAELHDRHVGLRKDMHEDGPGSVIETPAVVEHQRRRLEQIVHSVRQLR